MFCSLLKICLSEWCTNHRIGRNTKRNVIDHPYRRRVRIDRKCSRVRRPVFYFVNIYVDKKKTKRRENKVTITTGCASKIYKKKVLFLIYTEAIYAERKYVSHHEYIEYCDRVEEAHVETFPRLLCRITQWRRIFHVLFSPSGYRQPIDLIFQSRSVFSMKN